MSAYTLPNGKQIFCDRPDVLHEKQAIDGFYNLFWPILQGRKMVALDVGTSCGDSTAVIAGCLGDESLVIGFEANQLVFPVLQNNISQNSRRVLIDVHAVVAGDVDGMVEFVGGLDNGGVLDDATSRLTEKHDGVKFSMPSVNVYSYLCKMYPQEVLDSVGFVKIDTEGYDFKVLRGLRPLIIRNKMPIVVEWWPESPNSQQLFSTIDLLGYRAFSTNGESVSHNDLNTPRYSQDLILKPV